MNLGEYSFFKMAVTFSGNVLDRIDLQLLQSTS